MKYKILLISICLVSVVQAGVYKYTNKQGKTAYSDTPITGAEKIIVPPVMTYKAPAIPVNKAPIIEKKTDMGRVLYQQVQITSPVEQESIRSNAGAVTVAYNLQPPLQEGDRVELILDGVPQQSFNLQSLSRGKHVVRVSVFNDSGEELISSLDVTFYLLRHSVQ